MTNPTMQKTQGIQKQMCGTPLKGTNNTGPDSLINVNFAAVILNPSHTVMPAAYMYNVSGLNTV